jgi:hypothetical protein
VDFSAKIDAARLANSISQSGRSTPTHGGAFDSPSHGSQIFHFGGADPIAARQRTNLPWKGHVPKMRLVARRREQKRTPASGEELGPGAAKLAENRVCISFEAADKRCSMGRANSRSRTRFASSQRRLLAGAFYSNIFVRSRGRCRIYRVTFKLISRPMYSISERSDRPRDDRSGLAGIKRSPIQSPERSRIAIFLDSVTWHIRQARWKEIDSVCSTDEGIWSWRMKWIPRRPTVST